MGISTDAMVWFGYPGEDDFVFEDEEFRDSEGDFTVEVFDAGGYDEVCPAIAIHGSRQSTYCFGGTELKPLLEITEHHIAYLKAAAEKHNFPTHGKEPGWYFSAHRS